MFIRVSGTLLPRKIAPRLALGLDLVLGLGTISLGGNCPRTVHNVEYSRLLDPEFTCYMMKEPGELREVNIN